MKKLRQLVTNLITGESGQDLIEYALIAALIGLAAVASVRTLGTSLSSAFATMNSSLTTNV